ncbi:MAG: hypothetical protein HW380_3451 [Magnetococcales bacterium]|nr:hypothetical protein [Magnetococcales bacterium]
MKVVRLGGLAGACAVVLAGGLVASAWAGVIQGPQSGTGGGNAVQQQAPRAYGGGQSLSVGSSTVPVPDKAQASAPDSRKRQSDDAVQMLLSTQLSTKFSGGGRADRAGSSGKVNPISFSRGGSVGGVGNNSRVKGNTRMDSELRGGAHVKTDGQANRNSVNVGGMQE